MQSSLFLLMCNIEKPLSKHQIMKHKKILLFLQFIWFINCAAIFCHPCIAKILHRGRNYNNDNNNYNNNNNDTVYNTIRKISWFVYRDAQTKTLREKIQDMIINRVKQKCTLCVHNIHPIYCYIWAAYLSCHPILWHNNNSKLEYTSTKFLQCL